MKINDGLANLQPVAGASRTSPVAPVSEAQRSQPPAVSGDHTEVSTAASLANRAMSVSDVRMDKVAEVQQALASNTYAVSAGDVADKIVSHMLGL